MKKIMIVFGTRPEAIKLCPLINEFKKTYDYIDTFVCVTAQHREMLDQFLTIFDVIPDIDLDIMRADQTLFEMVSAILKKIEPILLKQKPDIVIVQGDTTTTFAVALAAYFCKIPIGHVEAGLRTGNKYSPFPEEANRKLTGCIADLHFAATDRAKNNLLMEGIPENTIFVTGNTVIDALLWTKNTLRDKHHFYKDYFDYIDFRNKLILVTGHRRENFGQGFVNFCNALKSIALDNMDVQIVYPVHPNPNVKRAVMNALADVNNIYLIAPLDYEPFIFLLDRCHFVITDSGGIQEEAPSFGKPVLITRDTTERPEAVEVGAAKLVGTNSDSIIEAAENLLNDPIFYNNMSTKTNPFGDGKATKKIAKILADYLS